MTLVIAALRTQSVLPLQTFNMISDKDSDLQVAPPSAEAGIPRSPDAVEASAYASAFSVLYERKRKGPPSPDSDLASAVATIRS